MREPTSRWQRSCRFTKPRPSSLSGTASDPGLSEQGGTGGKIGEEEEVVAMTKGEFITSTSQQESRFKRRTLQTYSQYLGKAGT